MDILKDKEISVGSFEEFESVASEINAKFGKRDNAVLFRGHSNSGWSLETTLERWFEDIPGYCPISGYYKIALRAKAQIESFTGSDWDGPMNPNEPPLSFSRYEDLSSDIPYYPYLTYLRHHGFPSPLLDWSSSQYIAAFFAFSKVRSQQQRDGESVAIYAYCETPQNFKVSGSGKPVIRKMGPYVKTHIRHFNQKSLYTICGQYESNKWSFVPHQLIFDDERHSGEQDYLWKIKVPASERSKVLQKMDLLNLNNYSLFQTEESLLDDIAFNIQESIKNSQR